MILTLILSCLYSSKMISPLLTTTRCTNLARNAVRTCYIAASEPCYSEAKTFVTAVHGCLQQLWTHGRINTHTQTYKYRFLSGCKEVEHRSWQLSRTLQFPTSSQHHSPTWILPHNHTNIRIHAHTMPTHASPTWTCKMTMERGFS